MRDEQLQDLTEQLTDLTEGLEKSQRRALDIITIKEKLDFYKNALDSLKMDLRNVQNASDVQTYTQKKKNYGQALRKFKSKLEWAESTMQRGELLDGASDGMSKGQSAEEFMNYGLKKQEETKDALSRTAKTIEETKQVGRDVTVKLEEQTAQLESMYDALKETQGTLQRSTAILKRMARKTMTDKYVWCVVSLVGIAILGLILYKVINPETDVVPDELNPAQGR